MVLGIRSKSRKSVSIQAHYIIHVQEIKPWPPSQSLRSAQSILLQWENGDQNSGSLASTAGTGKIEFNESFRLSVLMSREVSKRGKHRESFLKNCIEFHLYDKTVKSQLLGSATLNLADFGIIKETKALNILLNLKRSFRSSSQPSLYVSIQPFDLECSSSSPSSSLSKELSLDKEESESVSQSLKDDDTEIASFTDDDIDSDDIASNSFQTTRSASQSSRDSIKIREGGTEESHGKFVLPSESTTSSLHGSREGAVSAQFNGIKSPSSSTVLCSDMENAANGRPSLPKISEESVKLADTSSEIRENTQQSSASSMEPNFERSFLSQVTQEDSMTREDGSRDQIFNNYGRTLLPKISEESVKLADTSSEIRENIQQSSASSMEPNFERSFQSQVTQEDSMTQEDGSRDQRFNNNGRPSLPKISEESVKLADTSSEIRENIQQTSASTMEPNFERSFQSQMTQEDNMTQEDGSRDQRFNNNGRPSLPKISEESVKLADTSSEIRENIQQTSASSMEPNFERSFQSQMTHEDSMTQEDGSRDQRFNDNGRPSLPKISEESVKRADTSSEIRENIQQYSASGMEPNFERYFQSQVTQEDSMTQEDGTRDQRFNKDALEKVSSVSNTGVMEDKEKMEEGRKGQEQFTVRNEFLENELVNNFSDDDSTKKGTLNSVTLLLNKKSDEHPTSILMNNKTEDVTNVKFPIQSAENYGLFISNQIHNQAEEINTMNDVHVGTSYHEDINVNGGFLGNKTELKAEVEMLREELREAAALEVSMYSVIAEHGSSTNKVHAPARRLSRFYFHACRVGSPATIASAAQSAVSGFVLVSKACGNDVPRLTFWFSNIILLRAIVSKGVENIHFGDGPCTNNECDVTGNTLHEEEKDNTEKHFLSWEDPQTFLVTLEKVEAWIFSRIVESVWWQTLTPYMQSAAAKSSSSRKAYEKRYRIGNQDQGSFSIDLWKRAFKDACERLCPLRAGGHECGCLPVIARLVMEQLVSRLDVAMFNAILRESAEEMPMDPISDPISDSKVLPIPAGKSGFGPGAQLKNAIGDWSRWLSDLFSIDDSDSYEVSNESDEPKIESSFKPFQLLNALSDLMMLPLDMLADGSMRKEVCPRFGISLIKQVVNNFVPDEFSPGPIPDAVLEALNDEDIEDDEGSITSFPCSAGSAFYAPPPASSIVGMLQEVRAQTSLRSGSFLLKKLYTSDDELDELDSPLSALGMDDSSFSSKEKFALVKGGRKVVRYDLLREAWKSTE